MTDRPAPIRAKRHRRLPTATLFVISLLGCAPLFAALPPLGSAVVRGSSAYTPAELYEIYGRHLGSPIDRELASAIVTALADRYVADGYARPRITVDDALVSAGILRLDVTETRVASIEIRGDAGPYRERLERLAGRVDDGALFRRDDLQAVLRRMRALPGLSLSTTTARDDLMPNAYRVAVETDFDRLTGRVRTTNRGTDEVGPHFVLGQLTAHGLAGPRTQTGLVFGAAGDYDEYRGLGLNASIELEEDARSLSFAAFRSRSRPTEAPADRDLLYVRDRLSIGFSERLSDRDTGHTTLSVHLRAEDLGIDLGEIHVRDERLRMLETRLGFRHGLGTDVQYAWELELTKGLDALGSGLTAIDLAEDPRRADFLVARASFIRLAALAPLWTWRIDAFAQQSPHVLPYSERFKIGGDRLGRGFEVTEIAGDHGIGAKLELRRRLAAGTGPRHSVYGFYDLGATWKQDLPGRESAATTGLGFATSARRLDASVELATPLTHADVEGDTGTSLFVELSWQL